MGLTSLQVCMDSSDWLQGTIQEAESSGCMIDSSLSSPSTADMLAACTRPPAAAVAAAALMEGSRRLRPPHDQLLKCPRCESTHTKFCYYNNYSLSQPRYFCKTCRRYWTKGGTLRNIPVGGGCRRNKKPSSSATKKSATNNNNDSTNPHSHQNFENTPCLSSPFPHNMSLSHLNSIMGGSSVHDHLNSGFLESKYAGNVNLFPQNPKPNDILDSKFDFMGINNDLRMVNQGINGDNLGVNSGLGLNNSSFRGLRSPAYGLLPLEVNNGGGLMDTCQRLMLTYDHNGSEEQSTTDVKPNPKLLSLDWQQDQGCSDAGKDGASYGGYIDGLGSSWNGMINGYGSLSTRTNSLF